MKLFCLGSTSDTSVDKSAERGAFNSLLQRCCQSITNVEPCDKTVAGATLSFNNSRSFNASNFDV